MSMNVDVYDEKASQTENGGAWCWCPVGVCDGPMDSVSIDGWMSMGIDGMAMGVGCVML